ncbi:multidrug effflux MFS transporter [Halarcobacter anaerophilus]|jgi:DHA1 family bicyclomycin/chloramphenicol resistance-like MFS transporter|uniref:Bcr/CflA family drug resistance efflux transporter n=1 Tax=Halarcobacter anaerophilus TaxID=877500 RepID=A0A4Q0XWY8_9BACT|nr:multidrug effflux MFS transporter [Halarcobacter anaerophilus]QDF30365.1 drug resistance transporter, Bcr/CflA family [Halarcobacter anaerophilus]RXJ61545.1 Bcr/CflA family drug resistance efflux transporter [Halarcobacter anaerophilus]
MKKAVNHIYLIVLLSILSSVAPIATDTYIPSIPEIASDFNVTIEKIELTLSIFLIGFSIGQIFGGPISDRIGRRKSSLFGLMGFAFFSFIMIFSSTIYELWLYRFFEAIFGGIVVVNAMAVVRDKFHGTEAAKVFSLIGTIRSIAPLIAPAIGSLIIHFFSWQAVFLYLTLYALFTAFLIYKDLDESYTYVKQSIYQSYKMVLTHKTAMKAMLTLALGFSGFFIFIAKSSFIYIEYFKISTDYFPLFFGFNFIILIGMIKVNIEFLKKFNPIDLVKYSLLIQIITGVVWIINYNEPSLTIIMILMATYMSMMAFVFGNCMALALEHFSQNAGVASGVVGVLQFGLGAIISSIALVFHSNSFLAIGVSITLISIIAFLIIRTYK